MEIDAAMIAAKRYCMMAGNQVIYPWPDTGGHKNAPSGICSTNRIHREHKSRKKKRRRHQQAHQQQGGEAPKHHQRHCQNMANHGGSFVGRRHVGRMGRTGQKEKREESTGAQGRRRPIQPNDTRDLAKVLHKDVNGIRRRTPHFYGPASTQEQRKRRKRKEGKGKRKNKEKNVYGTWDPGPTQLRLERKNGQ